MNQARAGEAARRELGLGAEGPIPDLLRLVEDEAGLFVFVTSLGEDGIDGAFQQIDGERFALVNQDRSAVRKRFTLAHEFGHDFLKHGSRFDQKISFQAADRCEREANQFASELLAPRSAIDQWLARNNDPEIDLEVVVRIACYFNVSALVIRYRLQNEGRLSSTLGKQIDDDIFTKEHLALERRLGLGRAQDTITAHHGHGGYIPAAMQAKIGDLLRRGLLGREAAASLLRVSEEEATEQIEGMLEGGEAADKKPSG
jgi:Zn-dependent peptidase ImmA (M78 family)